MIFFSDFKFMLDAKGTTEVIKTVACLNICKNYFKPMKKKYCNARDQQDLWNATLGFKVTALCFRKNEEVSQITELLL